MSHRALCVLLILVTSLLSAAVTPAAVTLASPFSDHAVLQRDRPLPLWGTADPGETLMVTCAGQHRTITADVHGRWSVTIDPLTASGPPVTITVIGSSSVVTVRDLLVGEVWVCSGQSNMEWPVSAALDHEREIRAADLPQIRLFTVAKKTSDVPLQTCGGTWVVCSPASIPVFSAVAYYFGRHLHRELQVPIGLINVSWGGTPAEAWTSRSVLSDHPDLREVLSVWDRRIENSLRIQSNATAPDASHKPGTLRHAMITPLLPYAIRGAIWYQGEANASRAKQYRSLLPAMIGDWRQAWGQGEFPFYLAQLANLRGRNWPELREAQWLTAQSVANTGMAVTIDIGERDNVHPRNKQEVGRRLALIALARTYGKTIAYSGPVVTEVHASGANVVVSFSHDDGGLVAHGNKLTGFEIAGPDGVFLPVEAVIVGARVVLSHAQVGTPCAVRYAWADDPICSLYNGAGFPAGPFRCAVTPAP